MAEFSIGCPSFKFGRRNADIDTGKRLISVWKGKVKTQPAPLGRLQLMLALPSAAAVSGRLNAGFRRLAGGIVLGALLFSPVCSEALAYTATQFLTAKIVPLGGLFTITPSPVTLTSAGTVFTNYTSSAATIQYRVRTTQTTGSGNITIRATTDFPCASGGPCIAVPPTAGDKLTYTCSGVGLGSCVSGTVSTASATNLITIPASSCTGGGGSCSGSSPNTVNVNFALTNDPKYKTGAYTATLTFTITAL